MGHEDPIAGQKLRVCYGVVAAMRLPDRALEAFPTLFRMADSHFRLNREKFPILREIAAAAATLRRLKSYGPRSPK